VGEQPSRPFLREPSDRPFSRLTTFRRRASCAHLRTRSRCCQLRSSTSSWRQSIAGLPSLYDEHYFLNEGLVGDQGVVPYRDFQEFKPP